MTPCLQNPIPWPVAHWITNLYFKIQHRGEEIMTEFSFLGDKLMQLKYCFSPPEVQYYKYELFNIHHISRNHSSRIYFKLINEWTLWAKVSTLWVWNWLHSLHFHSYRLKKMYEKRQKYAKENVYRNKLEITKKSKVCWSWVFVIYKPKHLVFCDILNIHIVISDDLNQGSHLAGLHKWGLVEIAKNYLW